MSQTEADGVNAALPSRVQSAKDRFQALENHDTYLTQQLQNVPQSQPQPLPPPPPPPPPSPPTQPNLNLPTPPYFSGVPSELIVFRLKLNKYILGNHNTYTNAES